MDRGEILVVDDEASVRETVSRILQSKGFETSLANGPHEALAAVQRLRPGLVLSDIKMPQMDGVELARQIKQSCPDTPVILMTAYATVDTAIQSLKLGVDDYITKPINWPQAVASIHAALDRRFTTVQNRKYVAELEQQLMENRHSPDGKFLGAVRDLYSAQGHTREMMLDTVESLAMTMGAKSPLTKDHSQRVGIHAGKMAKYLSFSEEEIRQFRMAGLLHDIGKIGLRDDLLSKSTGDMNDDELAEFREHPLISHRILQPIREFQPILGAVLHHHERFDGTGYPDRLRGEQIPVGARMVAVADTFANSDVDDGHDECIQREFAIDRLMAERGTRLDPQMVDALIEVLQGAGP
ncbi:MAG: HD domain-containing phosphohydrolase [Planctomycetota bacterium]